MKIKLALLEKDQNYLNRVVSILTLSMQINLKYIRSQKSKMQFLHSKVCV